ncbi:MAG: trypsin-like peptidase domain-containing protein [Thermogutta sp.]|uniref:S1C family serine protease n=1 Tax=Thermogutta sp. TaxID=1962930 RepID=UPI0019C88E6F|nr:trypsin-like peptidase domain-containing protein [Thermogutta sp.]MBC7351046.1 trypsin-like peptidase domain-containing protein [Thermogutta sp.]
MNPDPNYTASQAGVVSESEAEPEVRMSPPPEMAQISSDDGIPWGTVLRGLFWLVVFFGLLFSVPYLVEELSFAVTRGRLRAEALVARDQLARLPQWEERFRWVVKSVFPGVVGVEASRGEMALDRPGRSLPGPAPRIREESVGSGVIVDEEGYIVTSLHVVEQARDIVVRLADGRTIKSVQLVGSDPLNDLAVLKIPGSGLTAVPWGDSDQLEVGDTVLAIGNPYGLTRTVTAGIISAKERRAQSNAGGFQELLQTDAAMNPGNSGGPLVNVRGEIVGINSAIYGEAYRGISFAIPSRVARQAYEQIRREGRSRHGWLGVQMADLDEEEARSRKIPDSRGVVVLSVLPGSPAEKAGLRPGDVIRTWNGQVVEDSSALGVMVAKTPVGSEVPMEIYRQDQPQTLRVLVGQRPL